MIRALRPTDVLAYLAFRNHSPGNEALLGANGAVVAPNLRGFFGQSFALEPRRESWVQIENGHIIGLVSAKARFGADVWDIDQLMAAPSADFDRVVLQLLEHLCRAAIEDGVEKVFLRADVASPGVHAARQASFFQYTTEHVYRRTATLATRAATKVEHLRPRRPSDHLALFHLYSGASPARVRQIEGMTLQEWRWGEGWGTPRLGWRLRRDFVLPDPEGGIAAWIRADLRHGTLSLLVDSKNDVEPDGLVRFGLSLMPVGRRVSFPVREHQLQLGPVLEEYGFEHVCQHALLARALALRVPDTKLVPVHVS